MNCFTFFFVLIRINFVAAMRIVNWHVIYLT